MNTYNWNDWLSGWGWIVWFGFILIMFSSFGNWGYTYRAHRKFDRRPENRSFDILDERYARGDIDREQYKRLKSDILSPSGVGAESNDAALASPVRKSRSA